MQQMFQDYNDIAEFRLVYITEAHAAESARPADYAVQLGINQPSNYRQRCTTAELLISDQTLTIPVLIDQMDNAVNDAYSAHPDRVFVIRTDGRLAIAGARGPRGFAPALDDARKWLAEFRKTGNQPPLPRRSR